MIRRLSAGLLCGVLAAVAAGCKDSKSAPPPSGNAFDSGMKPPSEKDLKGIKLNDAASATAPGSPPGMPGKSSPGKAPGMTGPGNMTPKKN